MAFHRGKLASTYTKLSTFIFDKLIKVACIGGPTYSISSNLKDEGKKFCTIAY